MIALLPMLGLADEGASMVTETTQRLIIFSIYAVVILLIAAWAIFIRKQKSKRRRIRRTRGWQRIPEGQKHRHGRHRHHRSKGGNLPMNPTLAQSGGLPPIRPDDVPPKAD